MDDGQERPIAYASRTLTAAEKNYSQLEKETLGVVFGVEKFHNYLYRREFIIESDHRLLAFIFNGQKAISPTPLSRITHLMHTTLSFIISQDEVWEMQTH